MFVQEETQKQKELRHKSGNFMPEFLGANGRAESIAKYAGYTSETKVDSNGNPVLGVNGKPITTGIVQALAKDLQKAGDLTREEAEILIIGKKERNGGIAHQDEVSSPVITTMSVSEENYNKFNDVVNKVQDIIVNGSITYF